MRDKGAWLTLLIFFIINLFEHYYNRKSKIGNLAKNHVICFIVLFSSMDQKIIEIEFKKTENQVPSIYKFHRDLFIK